MENAPYDSGGWGGRAFLGILAQRVPPSSLNPYPVSDQNVPFCSVVLKLVLSKPILVFSPADLGKRFFLSLSEQKCETSSASKSSEKQAMKACMMSGAGCKSLKSAPFQCFWRIIEN